MIRKFSLFASLLLLNSLAIAQGPWAAGKKHGYTQLLFNTIPTYNTLYYGNGNTIETERELSDNTLAAYLEYGFSDRFTLIANMPYIFVKGGELVDQSVTPITEAGSLNGFGNISLSGKYTFIKKKFVAAAILQADLPTRSFDNATGLSTGVDALTLMPKLSVGTSDDKWFLYGYFGYGIRSNDYHHIVNYGIEGGYKVADNLTLILNLNNISRLDNGDPSVDTPTNIRTGFYTSNQEFNAFLLKLYAEKIYKDLGALVSLGGGTGTSVAVSPAISIGVFYKW
ncbi:MAG: transporter [Cyclobacteriaceae bacterium]